MVALLPVTAFLLLLMLFDSFKLVPRLMLVRALVMGSVAALADAAAPRLAAQRHRPLVVGLLEVRRAVTEETLKTFCLLYPLRRREIGFLVDAAIIGFAVGTGFALVENVDYLRNLGEARFLVWVVRGFGTAMLHATTAAIVAIAAKSLGDRFPERGWLVIVPGWIAAILLHSLFNHALVSPLLAAAMLLLVLPIVVIASSAGASARRASGSAKASTSTSSCSASCARCTSAARGSAGTSTSLPRASLVPWSPTCSACCSSSWSLRFARRAC